MHTKPVLLEGELTLDLNICLQGRSSSTGKRQSNARDPFPGGGKVDPSNSDTLCGIYLGLNLSIVQPYVPFVDNASIV